MGICSIEIIVEIIQFWALFCDGLSVLMDLFELTSSIATVLFIQFHLTEGSVDTDYIDTGSIDTGSIYTGYTVHGYIRQ